jgi:hypothetical protein
MPRHARIDLAGPGRAVRPLPLSALVLAAFAIGFMTGRAAPCLWAEADRGRGVDDFWWDMGDDDAPAIVPGDSGTP